jgi:transcriptional regulator with GAF, ATPase, and Fis domain
MPEILKTKHPQMAAHYSQGKSILFASIDECPQLPDLRKILNIFGTKAGVGVPLEIDESGVDIFAMDNILLERTWPKDIIEQSSTIGHILLSVLRRREAEIELRGRYDEIKQLKSRLELENIHLRKEIEVLYSYDEIVGKSRAIKNVLSQAEQVADQETSVLVLGETGTGKELLARAIHNISPRKKRAMITVNCAALPATLVEAELFGREKGAYTGALTKQVGRFELADKSTVFLDEIGDLPLEMQVKLLRVLQEGKFERLGSNKTITVDVRVIAATNHDLEQAVREGRFRKDLFYRLSVFPITVPPLRDRAEDIPMLVWAFVKDFSKRMGKTVENISNKTMDRLMNYTWPGNVRELRNVIERAMILHSGKTLHIEKIQAENQEIDQPTSLQEVERNHIRSVLAKKNWKVSGKNGAAEALGLKESTLRARMGKLGIKRGE